jgi:DNA-binding NtrC family response regulator
MVAAGNFRQDLLGRIAGFVLTLPPLAERMEDLGLIVRSLLRRLAPANWERVTFKPATVRALIAYPWPLNVRELEQCMKRALTLASDGRIDLEHLPETVRDFRPPVRSAQPAGAGGGPELSPREARECEELDALLRKHNGNIARVAEVLDKHRMQVQRLVKRYGLKPERYRK